MNDAPARPRRARAARVAKFALAALLLLWVGWRMPWRDALVYEGGEGVRLEAPGRLETAWREEVVRFHPLADPDPDPRWPAEVRRAIASGAPIEVRRGEAGLDWRPGLPRLFLDVEARGLAGAFAALFVGTLFGVTRWWRLLRLAGCRTGWLGAARLTYLGLFFNLVLPGVTGGDVVKAALVLRENPGARAAALVTVVLDRLIGLWALLGLAAVTLLVASEALAPLRAPVGLAFLAGTAGMALLLHPAPRRWFAVERWLGRLPQGRRLLALEHASRRYARHPLELSGAALLSLGNHLATGAALAALGAAFGGDLAFTTYLGLGSIANAITAVPLAPGGWGLGEAIYGTLFALAGAEAALGVAVSVTYRLSMHALGFAGGLVMLLPGGRVPEDVAGAEFDLEAAIETEAGEAGAG